MNQSLIRKTAEFLSRVWASPDEVKMFPADWLVDQITIQQAETRDDVQGLNGWNAIKAAMQPGDEIWSFCSPPETWEALMGSCGIVLLRNGRKIAQVVTVRN